MAQLERATSRAGRKYLSSGIVKYDEVEAKTLRLGGKDNTSGILEVYDETNTKKGTLDKDGIQYLGVIGATGFTGYAGSTSARSWFYDDEFVVDEPLRYDDGYGPIIFKGGHTRASTATLGQSSWSTDASYLKIGTKQLDSAVIDPSITFWKTEDIVDITTATLKVNGIEGISATQTFKDGAGATKTMTITNGIITGIA